MSVNIRRFATTQQSLQRALYFQHLLFKYKLVAYFLKSHEMVNAHRVLLKFQNTCRPEQHILKPVVRKDFAETLKLSFFSKPSRQLR